MIQRYRHRMLILVADDDEDDCLLVRDALRAWNRQAEIRFVSDGQALMDYLHACDVNLKRSPEACPDLILLDLNMPRKDGREALQEIKADRRLKAIPVVILSTSSDQDDINFCHSMGANSFISKSVDFRDFEEKMRVLGAYWFDVVSLPSVDPSAAPHRPAVKASRA